MSIPSASYWAAREAKSAKASQALRGTVVRIGAKALPLVPGLPGVFFKNAGWPSLKTVEGLDTTDPRYEPAVIPHMPSTRDDSAASYTDTGNLRKVTEGIPTVFYSVLDLLSKLGFAGLLIWGHRSIDPARLGLKLRGYDNDVGAPGNGGPSDKSNPAARPAADPVV